MSTVRMLRVKLLFRRETMKMVSGFFSGYNSGNSWWLEIQDYQFAISILSKQCMHRSFYQETWPEQMFDGEEWFKLSTPPSFGFGDLINDDDQPNIGCFIIDQGSRPGRRIMVIQLTAEIEHFTRSCIIIRTERVEIWRRQLTQFIIVPGCILTQFSSPRQTTKSSGTDIWVQYRIIL